MATELIPVGFGSILACNRIVSLLPADTAPTKRLVLEGKEHGLVLDMTSGRRTKAVLLLDDGHLALLAITPETLAGRIAATREA